MASTIQGVLANRMIEKAERGELMMRTRWGKTTYWYWAGVDRLLVNRRYHEVLDKMVETGFLVANPAVRGYQSLRLR